VVETNPAVSVAALAGIVYDHGFELLDDVPVQLLNTFPEVAVAVSVIEVPGAYEPAEHPAELVGEAAAEAPPVP
jgi:hypothetical protein